MLRVGVVVLGTLPAVAVASRNAASAIQVGLIAVYLVFLLVVTKVCRSRTPWPYVSPITTITFVWFFIYGPLSINKFVDESTVHASLLGSYREFHMALAITLLSNALLFVGFLMVFPSPITDKRPRLLSGNLSVPMLVAVWALSWGARAVQFTNKQYGYLIAGDPTASSGSFSYQMALTYGAQATLMVIAALALEVVLDRDHKQPTYRYLLAGAIGGEVIYTMTIGFKAVLLMTLLPALLVMVGLRAKFPMKGIVAVGLLFFVLAPGNYLFRDGVYAGKVSRGDIFSVFMSSLGYTSKAWSTDPLLAVDDEVIEGYFAEPRDPL